MLPPDPRLYAAFNAFEDDAGCWSYQEGALSMKVTRKGAVVSSLDADWLELTTFYYKQGFSLTDAFVCWDPPRGKRGVSCPLSPEDEGTAQWSLSSRLQAAAESC